MSAERAEGDKALTRTEYEDRLLEVLEEIRDEQKRSNHLLEQILNRLTEPVLRDSNYFEKDL